jgi:hypothetical protein
LPESRRVTIFTAANGLVFFSFRKNDYTRALSILSSVWLHRIDAMVHRPGRIPAFSLADEPECAICGMPSHTRLVLLAQCRALFRLSVRTGLLQFRAIREIGVSSAFLRASPAVASTPIFLARPHHYNDPRESAHCHVATRCGLAAIPVRVRRSLHPGDFSQREGRKIESDFTK